MNRTVLGVFLILAIAGLIAFYLHLQNSRYNLVGTGKVVVYKIDRRTGETWRIWGTKEMPVKRQE
jgi:hypothetical protein